MRARHSASSPTLTAASGISFRPSCMAAASTPRSSPTAQRSVPRWPGALPTSCFSTSRSNPPKPSNASARGKYGYLGCVQLMSAHGSAVLEHVKSIGEQHRLKMLPVLKKPHETAAILKILQDLRLGHPPTAAGRVALDEALSNGWIEFWYQPKIDLRKKQLVGVEAFARARHPQDGILMPGAFLPGATEADLIALSELALAHTLKAALNFAKLG